MDNLRAVAPVSGEAGAAEAQQPPKAGAPGESTSTVEAGDESGPTERQFELVLGANHDDPDDTHEVANAV